MTLRRTLVAGLATALAVFSIGPSVPLAQAAGNVFVVTTAADDQNDPAPGSFRQALLDAQAGDTIRFDPGLLIDMDDFFFVESDRDGLTIEGPVILRNVRRGQRRELSVRAHGVTIRNVTFMNVEVFAEQFVGSELITGIEDFIVDGCTFEGSSRLYLASTKRADVGDCTFRFAGSRRFSALTTAFTREVTVHDCTFEVTRGHALRDTDSVSLEVLDNTMDAELYTSQRSGLIDGNTVTGDDGVTVRHADVLVDSGHLEIRGNAMAALYAKRTDMTIVDNLIGAGVPRRRGKSDVRLNVTSTDLRGFVGDVAIRGNTIVGGDIGLNVISAARNNAPVEINGNIISSATLKELVVASPREVTVEGNTLTNCGGRRGRVRGAALFATRVNESLDVSDNTINGGAADGCVFDGSGDVSFKDNTVMGVAGDGVIVRGTPALQFFMIRNEVTNCGGDGFVARRGADVASVLCEFAENAGAGLVCESGGVYQAEETNAHGNGAEGVLVKKRGRVQMTNSTLRDNGGAGVLAQARSIAGIRLSSTLGNGGPGIDLWPRGVTENHKRKRANDDVDFPEDLEIDAVTGQLVGRTVPFAQVDVFESESGEGGHGGGAELIGSAGADADGRFVYPANGRLKCPPSGFVTVTATTTGRSGDTVTSELSENVECAPSGDVELISVHTDGTQGDEASNLIVAVQSVGSSNRRVSDDGRYVVFRGRATTLVAGDTDEGRDVFVRDRETGTTRRVSVGPNGEQANASDFGDNGPGDRGVISGDGRFALFQSDDPNLDPTRDPTRGLGHTYRKDLQTGAVFALGVHPFLGSPNPGETIDPSISRDGSVVAFCSNTRTYLGLDMDLNTIDSNNATDVYVGVVGADSYQRVSVSTAGVQGTAPSGAGSLACRNARISADGRYVAFLSYLDDLVPGLATGTTHEYAYVHDRQTGTTVAGSVDSAGNPVRAFEIAFSDDGRHLVFSTFVDGVVPGDTNGKTDIFLRDLDSGDIQIVNVPEDGMTFDDPVDQPTVSGDGRFVAFRFRRSPQPTQIYLRDTELGTTTLVSAGAGGPGNGSSATPDISADGRFLVFASSADGLVDGDLNFEEDVFLVDRGPQTTK